MYKLLKQKQIQVPISYVLLDKLKAEDGSYPLPAIVDSTC
jgi:hypothetical protein